MSSQYSTQLQPQKQSANSNVYHQSPPNSSYDHSSSMSTTTTDTTISAIPTLRVMRLQKPELHTSPIASTLLPSPSSLSTLMMESTSSSILQSALCLPDSLTVYVGETFTAYLGVLNTPSSIITTSSTSSIQQYPTIRRLSVVAQLQTPIQRYPLPSRLDPQSSLDGTTSTSTTSTGTTSAVIDVPPFNGVDTIVSRIMEEPGPHILRIEVGYYSPPDLHNYQTFRKFYRFQVKLPIHITELYTIRNHDTSCYTCIQVEYPFSSETTNNSTNTTAPNNEKIDTLVISNVQFHTPDGLIATPITTTGIPQPKNDTATTDAAKDINELTTGSHTTPLHLPSETGINTTSTDDHSLLLSAIKLYDQTQILRPGSKVSYLYHIQTNTPPSTLRGIAYGDLLGHISLQWYKAMGEHGTINTTSSTYSTAIHCPAAGMTKYNPNTTTSVASTTSNTTATPVPYVMYRSGHSVDVAATAAATTSHITNTAAQYLNNENDGVLSLITVEPVDPPLQMQLYVPVTVPLLIVNHSRHPCTIQIQFNIPPTTTTTSTKNNENNHNGIVVVGTTYQNIGTITSHGGSTIANFTFLPIQTGLLTIQYCSIFDVTSAQCPIVQPPLWTTYVVSGNDTANATNFKD